MERPYDKVLSPWDGTVRCKRIHDEVYTNVPHQRRPIHSPDGYEWGYGGSGPAELAYCALCMYTDANTAMRLHQDFKREFIATMPEEGGTIPEKVITDWIKVQKKFE